MMMVPLKTLVRNMLEKADIRKLVLQKRNSLSKNELIIKSEAICNQLLKLSAYKYAETIYIYMDFRNEVMTKQIIDNALNTGKKVALPKIIGDEMSFYYIEGYEDLKKGYFGIIEPDTKYPADEENAFIVIPGVAFDERGVRLGYGRGFYDRFLCKHMEFDQIAIAFEAQMVDNLPYDELDVTMERIITEERIILCRK